MIVVMPSARYEEWSRASSSCLPPEVASQRELTATLFGCRRRRASIVKSGTCPALPLVGFNRVRPRPFRRGVPSCSHRGEAWRGSRAASTVAAASLWRGLLGVESRSVV
jgi:hypothetical protein